MIKDKKSYKYFIERDLAAYQIKKISYIQYWRLDNLRFQLRLRKIEYLHNVRSKNIFCRIHLFFLQVKNHRLGTRLGFSIPKNVFDAGLCIVHYGTIVVSPEARVGENCRIHPSTCIGEYNGAPIIGKNVYIGPGAKLFGNIKVGDNVAVGANAVVNTDIPDSVTVGGVPAKIISNKSSVENGVYPEKFI